MYNYNANVAQWQEASVLGTECSRFESGRWYYADIAQMERYLIQNKIDVSSTLTIGTYVYVDQR